MTFAFWTFSYVWMGLSGLLKVASGDVTWPIGTPTTDLEIGQACILIGFLFFEVGTLLHQGAKWHPVPNRLLSPARVKILVAYALLSTPYWVHRLGGFHTLFTSRQSVAQARGFVGTYGTVVSNASYVGTGFTIALSTIPLFLALLSWWALRRSGAIQKNPWTTFILVALIFVNILLNNPISNPRLWAGTVAIGLVFASFWVRRRYAIRILVVLAVLFGVVFFPYAAYFRYNSGYHGTTNVRTSLESSGDFDSFQMVTVAAQAVQSWGHTDGKQFASAVLFFIPRSILPSKGLDTGTLLAQRYNLNLNNISAPLWAEMYLDFGFVGIILMFTLYGWLVRRLDDQYVVVPGTFTMIVVPMLAGYSFIILRGSLLQAMGRLATILIVLWFISAKRRTLPPPPQIEFPSAAQSAPDSDVFVGP